MTREDYLLKWESGKSIKNIIDDFGDFRDRLVDRITEYVKNHNGEVKLRGRVYNYAREDSITTFRYKKLVYKKGCCYVVYDCADGWEIGYETERVEEELWVFSMNEIFDIMQEIKENKE